jgi:DNA-binding NarL/FixJ family response regulator
MYPPVTQFETRALRLEPGTEEPLRVVVGEDSVLLRAGTVRLLEDFGFDVVAQAGDRDDLLRKVRAHRPDVAVIDIRMPPEHSDEGLQAAKVIRAEFPHVGVLVLSAHLEERYARELLEDGSAGVGYLLKDRLAELERFTDAVARVARGGSVLDPEVVASMIRGRRGALESLTFREREVLDEMAAGRSNRGIADVLFVSERAVERHVTSIFSKLELPATEHSHRRVLAVLAHVAAAS